MNRNPRLFGLHLTVRDADPCIDRALNRLLDSAARQSSVNATEQLDAPLLGGLPFAHSRRIDVILPATLFLCTIFGKSDDPTALELYRGLCTKLEADAVNKQDTGLLVNAFRALVVRLGADELPAVGNIVDWLAERQGPGGDWGGEIPFFQTVNALAHLGTPASHSQCQLAFKRISRIQNDDGTWGKAEREWRAFLVVHALRNKKLL